MEQTMYKEHSYFITMDSDTTQSNQLKESGQLAYLGGPASDVL